MRSETKKTNDEGVVLLFYKYVWITERGYAVAEHAQWHRNLCMNLGLKGKLRISREGINGTLAGSKDTVAQYQLQVNDHPLFVTDPIEWKTSCGHGELDFDELSVRVVEEIITLGIPPEQLPYTMAGHHLTPAEFHAVLADPPQNLVLIDCRNEYESQIGRFQNAIAPEIRKFSLWPKWVDEHMGELQNKKVLMYCTGGIRCERGSAYLKAKGLQEVYQLSGGIHKYIEQFPDGFFRGKNYVFDNRQALPSNDDILSQCALCCAPYDRYETCASEDCYKLLLVCESCRSKHEGPVYCCEECKLFGARGIKETRHPR